MKKILMANLASPENPGDMAILRGGLKLIQSAWPGSEITLSTRACKKSTSLEKLGCRVIPSYPDVEAMDSDSLFKKAISIPASFIKPDILKQAVKESDLVFLAGGAYFYSNRRCFPGLSYLSLFSAIAWADKFKKPLIFLPQSYGPFRSGISEQLFRDALKSATAIYYREHISGHQIKSAYSEYESRMRFMPDLALNLTEQDVLAHSSEKSDTGILGISVRSWKSDKGDEWNFLPRLAIALVRLQKELKVKIRIIVHVQASKETEGDSRVSHALKEMLENDLPAGSVEIKEARPYYELDVLGALYKECDFVIGMRLHAALLAMLVGTPAYVVGYQHKSEGVLADLDLSRLFAGYFTEIVEDRIVRDVRQLWKEKQMLRMEIGEGLKRARKKIRDEFEMSAKRWLS